MLSDAREGLQRADQGHRRTAWDGLDQRVIDRLLQSGCGARVFVRVLKQNADTDHNYCSHVGLV